MPRLITLIVAAAAVAVAAVTVTATAAHAFTVADCKPRGGMQLAQCARLTRFCASKNIRMGWVNTGCTGDDGIKSTDGGCQCGNPNE